MIGVFDSGSGGLTVMRALERALPTESFVYLGDHRNTPYGNRSADEIYLLVRNGVETLFNLGCTLVVVACNTAAASALRGLQRNWLPATHPEKRVIGVVVPIVEAITGVLWSADDVAATCKDASHVAVFATSHTVQSYVFSREIGRRAPNIRVSEQSCPALAELIDYGASDASIRAAVRSYVEQLLLAAQGVPDTYVLACTHFPLVRHIFVEELPAGMREISQADVTAVALQRYLERNPQFRSTGIVPPTYLTTGSSDLVSRLASRYYGRKVTFRQL